jgi:hypothetical protein
MPEFEHRVVYTNGTASYLMEGDPEADNDRFFFMRATGRFGAALPQLLAEGWRVVSVTAVNREVGENYGASIVVLQRAGAGGMGYSA